MSPIKQCHMNTIIILIINVKHVWSCKEAYLYQLQSMEDDLIPAKSRSFHFSDLCPKWL
jgi:hypothetical protein